MKTIPIAGHSSNLWLNLHSAFRPISFMEGCNKKHGDFYKFIGKDDPSLVITSNPQAIKEILDAPINYFDSGKGNKNLSFLLGDNSLILLDGKAHQHRRRLLMPAFHGESLKEYSQQIVSITNEVVNSLTAEGGELTTAKSFEVRPLMQEITLKVMLSIVFGVNSGKRYEKLKELLVKLLETFNNPLNSLLMFFPVLQKDLGKYSPWGRFLLLKAEIKEFIYEEIRTRRELIAKGSSTPQDIFGLLLSAKDEKGEGMSDEELHDELITLLFAGHETTATALSWLFYWIHYHPETEAKLREEISSLKAISDYKAVNNLSYLNAVISETLRIYPIVSGTFVRIPKQPISILGYKIEKNDYLSISIYNLHHRQDLYPNSKQFKPARFLDKKYSSYEYLPFGGGNRRCLGYALALLEMKLIATTILSRFQLALTSDRQLYPQRRGITLAPPSFKMIVKQNEEPALK